MNYTDYTGRTGTQQWRDTRSGFTSKDNRAHANQQRANEGSMNTNKERPSNHWISALSRALDKNEY